MVIQHCFLEDDSRVALNAECMSLGSRFTCYMIRFFYVSWNHCSLCSCAFYLSSLEQKFCNILFPLSKINNFPLMVYYLMTINLEDLMFIVKPDKLKLCISTGIISLLTLHILFTQS